jgi:hypothetical protein
MEPGHRFPGIDEVHAAQKRGLSKTGRIDDTAQSRHHRGSRVVAVQAKRLGGIVGDTAEGYA